MSSGSDENQGIYFIRPYTTYDITVIISIIEIADFVAYDNYKQLKLYV